MSNIKTTPEIVDPSTGEPRIAHIVRKDDQMRGYLGEEIEALCGKKWVPSRDPENLPICGKCKAFIKMMNSSGSN